MAAAVVNVENNDVRVYEVIDPSGWGPYNVGDIAIVQYTEDVQEAIDAGRIIHRPDIPPYEDA